MTARAKIRDLTELEKNCATKYRAQLQAAEQEAARLREILGDLARVFVGRDGPVEMTVDALYEPVQEG